MPDTEDVVLNKNQIDMLDFLVFAVSSKEHPVNLAAAFGFRSYHEEKTEQIDRFCDYLAISSQGNGPGYIDDDDNGAWITKKGKQARERAKSKKVE